MALELSRRGDQRLRDWLLHRFTHFGGPDPYRSHINEEPAEVLTDAVTGKLEAARNQKPPWTQSTWASSSLCCLPVKVAPEMEATDAGGPLYWPFTHPMPHLF